MKIQVVKIYNFPTAGFKGAAVTHRDYKELAFIYINAELSPEEQRKTMRHEVWHCLCGDVLCVMDPDGEDRKQAELEAVKHEADTTLDRIVKDARLWERAVIADWNKPTELVFP